MSKLRTLMLAIPALVLCSGIANADLRQLIDQNTDPTAVVVPVPFQDSSDGYGLMTQPPEKLAQELELSDPQKLSNSYFTVVENQGSDPLPVTDFDGRDVLYHLMQARAYYAKLAAESGRPDAALDHHVIVRLHVDKAYNLVLHFAQLPDYNNSRYIPANYAGKWGREIWFDERKPQLQHVDWYNLVVSSGFALSAKNWLTLGITAPLELLEHYNAGLDAAKMPDVVYHEAFHWATDTSGLFQMASEGNPVAEDYANYFGTSIVGRPEIAEISDYTSRFFKRSFDRIRPITDTNPLYRDYNSTTFGPSIFWQIRKWLGQERADQLIWNSISYLKSGFLETEVPTALLDAAKEDSSLSSSDISRIAALLQKYHQSYVNLDIKAGNLRPQTDSNAKTKPSLNDLSKLLNQVDNQTLTQKGIEEADQIRKLPDELRAQGVTVTPEQEARINAVADALARQAMNPDFRAKVAHSLKNVGHGFKRAGIDVLEGMGYVGSAVYSISAAPLTFGTDFTVGLLFGHGYLSANDQRIADQFIGGASGVAAFYYAYVGLAAIGYTFSGPINLTSLGVIMVNGVVCGKADLGGASGIDRYCRRNSKLMQIISLDTAKAGARAGDGIHIALKKTAHFVAATAKKLFHR